MAKVQYIEHQPIERQCLRFERAGIPIAPQTLGRSVAVAIDKLGPLAEVIDQQTRGPGLLGTDATSIPVLDRDAPDGIRMGTMWAWTNALWVTFFYSPAGDSDSERRFLGEDLCRTVQRDGTSVTTFRRDGGGARPQFEEEDQSLPLPSSSSKGGLPSSSASYCLTPSAYDIPSCSPRELRTTRCRCSPPPPERTCARRGCVRG